MYLEKMTSKEISTLSAKAAVVIVPVGSMEQHGPHLPLGTDTYIVYEVAKRAARNESVVVAPPIWYSYCYPSAPRFAGHVTIPPDVLASYIEYLIRGLAWSGFKYFVVLFNHFPNTNPCNRAAQQVLEMKNDVQVAVINLWLLVKDLVRKFKDDGYHAESRETSLIAEAQPHLLRKSKIVDDQPSMCVGYDLYPELAQGRSYTGVVGSPSRFSREKGDMLAEEASRRLLLVVKFLLRDKFRGTALT